MASKAAEDSTVLLTAADSVDLLPTVVDLAVLLLIMVDLPTVALLMAVLPLMVALHLSTAVGMAAEAVVASDKTSNVKEDRAVTTTGTTSVQGTKPRLRQAFHQPRFFCPFAADEGSWGRSRGDDATLLSSDWFPWTELVGSQLFLSAVFSCDIRD